MKVLVTGGTGFLGRSVVRRLTAAGDCVRVLVRPASARRGADLSGAERITGDLCDPPSLQQALDGMEAVCHCAARVETGGPWSEFEAVTVRGTESLLKVACGQRVRRFVHVSSLGVYGLNGQQTIPEEAPFDEGQDERGYYTRAKIEAERLVWQYAQQGLPMTVMRPGPLYGPGKPPVVARLCIPLGSKLQLVIARADQCLPLTYVKHVAEAIHLALHSERAIGKAYNVVDGDAIQQGQYLALLREVGLNRRRTILLPPTPFYPVVSFCEQLCRWLGVTPPLSRHQLERALASVCYDTTRAREDLGWSPKVGLKEALHKIRAAQEGNKSD